MWQRAEVPKVEIFAILLKVAHCEQPVIVLYGLLACAIGVHRFVHVEKRLHSSHDTCGQLRASVASCTGESDFPYRVWCAGAAQKMRVCRMSWAEHCRTHLWDPGDGSGTFTVQLAVLLSMVLSARPVVLRMVVEGLSLAR